MNRIERYLIRTFCSRPGPLSYLVMLASFAVGIFFGLLSFSDSVQKTVIYQQNVLTSPTMWGWALLAGSSLVLGGLIKKSNNAVRLGAMINFVMWFFAAISYASVGSWVAFAVTAAFHILVQAHFYLSASFDTLFRRV